VKKLALLVVVFSLFITASHAQHAAQSPATGFTKPDAKALKRIKAGKAYLVDVRTPEEFAGGHLQYAANINYNSPEFKSQISKLDKSKPVYLYCRSGNRSGKAADSLKAYGFTTFYNIGGFEQLKSDGFPADASVVTASKQ
jgi:phage shock protein E